MLYQALADLTRRVSELAPPLAVIRIAVLETYRGGGKGLPPLHKFGSHLIERLELLAVVDEEQPIPLGGRHHFDRASV